MDVLQWTGDRVRRDGWVVVVLAITVIGSVHRGEDGPYAAPNAWAGLFAVLSVAPLFWRERRPDLTVVVNTAAVVAYFAWSPAFPDGPIYLSIFFSTYALVSRRPPRVWLPLTGSALVAIVVALLVREARVDATSNVGIAARMIWFVMVDTAAAAVAVALRSRRDTRTEQVRRTATEERLRMAQDLHDGVGHGLAVIAMQAGVALHVLERDPAAARRSLEAIRDTSKESLDALRAELVRLSPSGGPAAPRTPRNGLADLEVLVARVRAGGIRVELDLAAADVPGTVGEAAYVVVQESLTNVLRHADATSATVVVRQSPTALEVTVTDDGRGSPAGRLQGLDGHGLGIPGMRSRVEALGGTLETGSLVGDGFRVHAVVPIEEERRE